MVSILKSSLLLSFQAVCVAVGPGQVNCTCPIEQGYIGDGRYRCYGNLIKEIQDHPNLTIIANLLNVSLKCHRHGQIEFSLNNI